MNIRVIIWIVLVIVLLIVAVKCQKQEAEPTVEQVVEQPVDAEPIQQQVVVTEELVSNEDGVSLTTTVDDYIALTGAVLFALDSAELTDESKGIIDERIFMYRGRVQNLMDIEVIGYADISGEEQYNLELSRKRAQAVADYLEQQTDIPHSEIKVIAKGSTEADPLADDEREHALERRVVVHFVGIITN